MRVHHWPGDIQHWCHNHEISTTSACFLHHTLWGRFPVSTWQPSEAVRRRGGDPAAGGNRRQQAAPFERLADRLRRHEQACKCKHGSTHVSFFLCFIPLSLNVDACQIGKRSHAITD